MPELREARPEGLPRVVPNQITSQQSKSHMKLGRGVLCLAIQNFHPGEPGTPKIRASRSATKGLPAPRPDGLVRV
jgi:hypothetical protein